MRFYWIDLFFNRRKRFFMISGLLKLVFMLNSIFLFWIISFCKIKCNVFKNCTNIYNDNEILFFFYINNIINSR